MIYSLVIKQERFYSMDKISICPICGEPTYLVYGKHPRKDGLCYKHSQMLFNKEIEQCPDCGKWHETDKPCDCKIPKEVVKVVDETFETPSSKKCLLCENDSGEFVFCKSCFAKYRNKTLLLKITVAKDQELELLDESYEGLYVCKDGHVVKSKSERDIDNYLFEHKIAHAYEKALIIDSEVFHPDFYLPELDVYLEHWGYDESNLEYTKRKEYKIPKYEKKGITLISTYEKDMKDVDTSLDIKLSKIVRGKVSLE